jgi:hypothetical protein
VKCAVVVCDERATCAMKILVPGSNRWVNYGCCDAHCHSYYHLASWTDRSGVHAGGTHRPLGRRAKIVWTKNALAEAEP